jgi:hypothetical protein
VEAIEFVAQPQTMYNFTVATAHTYFVGEGQWLVHNICTKDVPTIGVPGRQPNVRVMSGTGVNDAQQMFNDLTVGAVNVTTQSNGAVVADMGNGVSITFRAAGSRQSNFNPVINVNDPSIGGYWGIKFEP